MPAAATSRDTLVLTAADVRRLLQMPDCIDAVEAAFLRHARGEVLGPAVLGVHVHGGGFHVKAAGLTSNGADRPVFVAKINANFPDNPAAFGLPTIQGLLGLFDAADGRPLSVMDSSAITSVRTAAATAVAAKYLAPPVVDVTICGCGEQSRHQLRALACVRPIRRARAFDVDRSRAEHFAADMSVELRVDVSVVDDIAAATDSNAWITCTPAHRWFLGREHVARGAFVAAVGADHPEKQEIEPALLASGVVVADVLDQCAAMGDLHHALAAGVMRREDVRGELADIVSGRVRGRRTDDEIIIFDSTGTAIQDVAAASIVYRRALETRTGLPVSLSE